MLSFRNCPPENRVSGQRGRRGEDERGIGGGSGEGRGERGRGGMGKEGIG
jgi:hypothetical protein